ncbi:MAG TPA: gliding motility protein GldL [Chitinophagaceae bacterium]|nr:gliding motility protein GldL [Chitinophagaceae bacterium]HOZ52183.1 gliding motility protein GldL [Chitinophagaceae bacterium]
MRSIGLFFETKTGKYIKNLIIGLGASVVLIGALAKLQHWSWAGPALIVGMSVEAFIFAILGLLPPHRDYYWEKYYPGLDENPHVEAYRKGIKFQPTPVGGIGGGGSNVSATSQIDKMLEEANMNPANIKKLSESFTKFGESVNQVKDITHVTAATNEYAAKAKEATNALGQMKDTFLGASATLASFNNAADETAKFHGQVTTLTKNLGSLNQIYEVELQDANNHLKAMNKFYSNLVNASDAMQNSADDANKAKEQIGLLAKNLGTLNQVYGNMLSAMQGR